MNKYLLYILSCYFLLFISSCKEDEIENAQVNNQVIVQIKLQHNVSGSNIILGNTYTNSSGENYTLSKFLYYISNVAVIKTNTILENNETDSYHLINVADTNSLSFKYNVSNNNFDALVFYIGVDSLHNVSGAQTGALDPLNGMFWTWNSGYIMAKMEGNSASSTQPNNSIQYHIGGFSGVNNAIRKIILPFPNGIANTSNGGTCLIKLNVDINKWFSGTSNLRIADGALVMSVNSRSKQIADNYAKMFTIESVTNL